MCVCVCVCVCMCACACVCVCVCVCVKNYNFVRSRRRESWLQAAENFQMMLYNQCSFLKFLKSGTASHTDMTCSVLPHNLFVWT